MTDWALSKLSHLDRSITYGWLGIRVLLKGELNSDSPAHFDSLCCGTCVKSTYLSVSRWKSGDVGLSVSRWKSGQEPRDTGYYNNRKLQISREIVGRERETIKSFIGKWEHRKM